MIALITGSTGFVGSHLSDYLIDEKGLEVHGIKRPRSREEFTRPDVIYHEADITDYTGVSRIIREVQPNYIFHLAAQSYVPLSWEAPQATIITNVVGTLSILEAVRRECPEAFVQVAGSSEEYGLVYPDEVPIKEDNQLRPQSPYGVSKVAADLLSQQYNRSYGLNVVVTRGFNHTGPRRGEVFATSNFARQIVMIERGKEPIIRVGNLEARRDWTDVRDMVRAYWLAVTECEMGEAYNICSGEDWSIEEMLGILLKFSDIKIEVQQDPKRMRPSDVPVLLGDPTKFKGVTKWEPMYSFITTMEDLLDYWRDKI